MSILRSEELREAARAQNEFAFAAGLLPSRYVEDDGVLARVARLLASLESDVAPVAQPRRPSAQEAGGRRAPA